LTPLAAAQPRPEAFLLAMLSITSDDDASTLFAEIDETFPPQNPDLAQLVTELPAWQNNRFWASVLSLRVASEGNCRW
jgi:hypothetical protein